MPTLCRRAVHVHPGKNLDYELIAGDSRQYQSPLRLLRRIFTPRNVFVVVPTSLFFLLSVVILNNGIPPLYTSIRNFERNLPQHNLSFSQHSGVRYISFPDHIWGHGWNNILQEYLMLSYLAYITNRTFVFDDYTWSRLPLPYTIYDFALRPTRIPLNALITGPIAGGPMPSSPKSLPRAVSAEFWQVICPPERRRVITSKDSLQGLSGLGLVTWWKDTIEKHEDAICLEIDTNQRAIFDFSFFGGQQLLDIWPSLSKSVILTHFEWSPLVSSAVQRNFAILPDLVYADITLLYGYASSLHPNRTPPISFAPSALPASPSTSIYPTLLALHIRRGDFKGHCSRLASWGSGFHGFNTLEDLSDHWVPYNGSAPDEPKNRIEYYRKRCLPNQEEIVKRLHTIRTEHDAFLSEQHALSNVIQLPRGDVGSRSPSHSLRRVFVLTNAAPVWLNGLKRKLLADGWENVVFKGDLVLDKEQKGVDVAVDMSIAERAEVFVGNGFSSMSGNIVMLRTAHGLHPRTTRFL